MGVECLLKQSKGWFVRPHPEDRGCGCHQVSQNGIWAISAREASVATYKVISENRNQ